MIAYFKKYSLVGAAFLIFMLPTQILYASGSGEFIKVLDSFFVKSQRNVSIVQKNDNMVSIGSDLIRPKATPKNILALAKNLKIKPSSPSRSKSLKKYAQKIPSKVDLSRIPRASGGSEWACLSEALYFEARGETVTGMLAVAEVIINRRKSRHFPNSICGVVSQGSHRKNACQFSYKCDGIAEVYREASARDMVAKIAKIALGKKKSSLTKGATFYHSKSVYPRWARKFSQTARIGQHLFYRRRG